MKKKLVSIMLCASLALCLSPVTAWPATDDDDAAVTAAVTVGVEVVYGQTEARSMLSLVNEFRVGSDAWYWDFDDTIKIPCSDLPELNYDYGLEQVAMQRAVETALYWAHTRPDGSSCFDAYDECGYVYTSAGENIAVGYTSAAEAFEGWQEEDYGYSGQGHRRAMLDSSYTSVAVAHVTCNGIDYWVMELADSGETSVQTAATAAVDGDETVSVSLLPSMFEGCLSLQSDRVGNSSAITPTMSNPELGSSYKVNLDSSSFTWTSSDISVLTVFAGIATWASEGSATVTATLGSLIATVDIEVSAGYADVTDTSAWYYKAVSWAYFADLMSGYENGLFGPNDPLTRAQAAVVLWRYYEPDAYQDYDASKVTNTTGMPDVRSGTWYTGAANWAVANGVIDGKLRSDGIRDFDPSGTITREQLCKIIANVYEQLGGGDTSDASTARYNNMPDTAKVSSWARQSVAWALDEGVISGSLSKDIYYIAPKTAVTRAMMAKVMMNAVDECII